MSSVFYSVICVDPQSTQSALLIARRYATCCERVALSHRQWTFCGYPTSLFGRSEKLSPHRERKRECCGKKTRAGYRVNNVRWLITVYCRGRWWRGGFD